MDRRNDPARRPILRANTLLPIHQTGGDEGHRLHQHRRNSRGQPFEQQRLPLHHRNNSQRSDSGIVRLGNPGERDLTHSPYPVPASSFVQRAIQFCRKFFLHIEPANLARRCQRIQSDSSPAPTFRWRWTRPRPFARLYTVRHE